MRNKAPYELWMTQLKDEFEMKGICHHEAAEVYSFKKSWEFDMTPEETVRDYVTYSSLIADI
jgi:hypothetical protein